MTLRALLLRHSVARHTSVFVRLMPKTPRRARQVEHTSAEELDTPAPAQWGDFAAQSCPICPINTPSKDAIGPG